jgi:AcrR family transcriptional regulator
MTTSYGMAASLCNSVTLLCNVTLFRYSVKMGRPREHGPQTRQALLDAGSRIVGAEGAAAVTIRRLADEAGTTTRAVYSLFGDKDGLLRALFTIAAETMRRHHEAVPVDPGDPTREFPPLALAYRAAAREQPALYDLWFGRVTPDMKLAEEDAALAFRSFERVLSTIRRCIETGRFPAREPMQIGLELFGLVHGLASLELRGFFPDEATARATWTDGIGALVHGIETAPR